MVNKISNISIYYTTELASNLGKVDNILIFQKNYGNDRWQQIIEVTRQ